MICGDPECVCDNICCQECKDRSDCEKKCKNVRYKEKIYTSSQFLMEELERLAEEKDSWLICVAAERLKVLECVAEAVRELYGTCKTYECFPNIEENCAEWQEEVCPSSDCPDKKLRRALSALEVDKP